jgi:hypothetical protein
MIHMGSCDVSFLDAHLVTCQCTQMRLAWAATQRSLRSAEQASSVGHAQHSQRVSDLEAQLRAQTTWAQRLQEQYGLFLLLLFRDLFVFVVSAGLFSS